MARKALGRGFRGLISKPDKEPKTTEKPQEQAPADGLADLPMASIVPSPYQPRQHFDQEKLEELAASIREQGLIEPVVVRRQDSDRYELIVGERRWRAYQHLGLATIPARVMDIADGRMRELGLIENLQRDDLNPLEVAVSIDLLRQEHGLTHEVIAKRLGISRSKVSNTLRLLDLPEEVKTMVSEGRLSEGHGRAILSLPDALSQINCARKTAELGLSVREVEALVQGKSSKGKGKAKTQKPISDADKHVADLENRLRSHFGTQVHINDKKGEGTIVIEYYSHDDVARILEKMGLREEL